jgi:hypothetical protein
VADLLGVQKGEDGAVWMVWEYVAGVNLGEAVERGEADRAYALARDVIRAVDVLHMLGLVHGNVHERNVIVGDGGTWLTDASPLLYTDPEDDVRAVRELLVRVFEAKGLGESAEAVRRVEQVSLRSLGAALDGTYVPRDDREARETPRFKRKTFGWAVMIALVAVGVAVAAVWWWTRDTGRVVESRGDGSGLVGAGLRILDFGLPIADLPIERVWRTGAGCVGGITPHPNPLPQGERGPEGVGVRGKIRQSAIGDRRSIGGVA